jgi:pilus assembly protein FimV
MAVNRDKVIASAEKLVAKGKIEPAIKEYERLLDDNPNDVNTLNRIGDLWVRINRGDEAVRVFSRIAEHYSRDGFFLKAIAIFKKINKLDPSKLDIYAKLADLYAKQGLAMEAKSQYQILADYHLKHGDPTNALLTYKKISELDPNSINVHVKLADLYSQNSRTAEALKEYDRVGKMLLKRGMLDEAVQVFRKALKIDSGNLDLVDSLVAALLEAKDFDNSAQILNDALAGNAANPRLTALLGKTHLAKGDLRTARGVLEEGLASNPNDISIRELLADVYLRGGEADQALELISPVVDNALARSEGRVAVDMLNRILRAAPNHAPSLEKLVAAYTRLREDSNVVSALNSLVEAQIVRRNFTGAGAALRELIRREPENAQHREKLAFVQQQSGAGGAAVEAPLVIPTSAPSTPAVELENLQGGGDFELDLDSSEPVDISFTPEPPQMMSPPPIDAPFFEAPPEEPAADDLDFITEHLTEADVFAKYGLSEKAIEHLQTVLQHSPGHLGAYEKLLKVQLDEGDGAEIAETAREYLAVLRAAGDLSTASAVERAVITRGFAVDPSASRAESEISLTDFADDSASASFFPPAGGADDLTLDLDQPESANEIEFDLESMPFEEPTPVETKGEAAFDFEELAPGQMAEQPFFGTEAEKVSDGRLLELPLAEAVSEPPVEELGEIDFYIEQQMASEARSKLNAMSGRFPGNAQIAQRRARIDALSAPGPGPAPVPSLPSSGLSAADIEHELLSAIPDDDEEVIPTVGRPGASRPSPVTAPAMEEGNLFADEDDFFDLAAELEEELEEEADEVVSLSEEEQTLEQIFKEFKKGVEQQLDSEDYDTHYNLGIAYKEMGLIDEAIGEFQLASKDQKKMIECCSMLGLCFLEKGMPQLAIKWYTKGLESPEISDDEHLGLLYDLGTTYLEIGDTENAHKAFLEVYGVNTNYRDIVERIKQLEDVRH